MKKVFVKILKRYAATTLKCVMLLTLLAGVICIPWLIASEVWSFLNILINENQLIFLFILIPALYLSIKLWQWLYELLGIAMMFIGSLVDSPCLSCNHVRLMLPQPLGLVDQFAVQSMDQLPAAWTSIYALTQMPADDFERCIADGYRLCDLSR